MSLIQKFFVLVLPRKWAADMEAESRRWMLRCACGLERSWWDVGGIRWKAAGSPRRLLDCPRCGMLKWHTSYRKADENQTAVAPLSNR